MKQKLKTISDLVYKRGPIYMKIQLALDEWKAAYKKRNMKEDWAVIVFLNHFGEIKDYPKKMKK